VTSGRRQLLLLTVVARPVVVTGTGGPYIDPVAEQITRGKSLILTFSERARPYPEVIHAARLSASVDIMWLTGEVPPDAPTRNPLS